MSVTTVLKILLLPDCAKSGVHVITPFVALITGALFVPVPGLLNV